MTFYPLAQILLYLALLLAPPDATQITITSPDGATILLARGETGWTSGAARLSAANGQLTREENSQKETTSVADYVKALNGHDWAAAPKFTLHDATTLEKTAAGYLLRLDDGDPSVRTYSITYQRTSPAASAPTPTVNVLGAVARPGAYPLPLGATLLDAIAAAGGNTPAANTRKISIVRGPAGEKPAVVVHDADAILRGQAANPALLDHDTIYLPERIL